MKFLKIIRESLVPHLADNEFSQDNPDTGTTTEGRSIGYVRDKSAFTADRVWVTDVVVIHTDRFALFG